MIIQRRLAAIFYAMQHFLNGTKLMIIAGFEVLNVTGNQGPVWMLCTAGEIRRDIGEPTLPERLLQGI